MSSEPFDPYYKWLGIPPKDQPADNYRLLGINRYETDQDVIVNAADRVMAHIRSMGTGRYSDQSQKILNEISRAKLVLLNADKKTAYDAELRAKDVVLAPPAPPAGSAVMRAAPVRPQAVPPAAGSAALRSGVPGAPVSAPVQAAAPVYEDDSGSYDNVMVDAEPVARASTSSIGRRKPAASGNSVLYAAIAGGVVAVGGLGFLVMGGSGETPRPIAHHDKDKPHKEDTSGKGKSTGSPSTTEHAPPAVTSPPAAVSTSAPPPFGATTGSPQPVATGSTPRPSNGGNWPSLPFDPNAVRPAVDREKINALGRQASDLERNRDYTGIVGLLEQHEDAVQADRSLCVIRARAFINLKQLDRAEKDLRRRCELEPENSLAVHEVITVQLAQGNRADARKTFAAAFEKFEDAAQAQNLVRLGYMAVSMSDPGMPWSKISAVTQKAYDQIRSDNPTNGLSWFVTRGHGAVLVRKAAAERNAELARTAMPMFRGSVMAWDMLFLGLAHHTTGSKSASDEQLAKAAEWQRSFANGRNWQEQLELAIIQRDLAENFGLRMDAAGTPPVGSVAMPGGPTPGIPGTPGSPGNPLPGGLGSLVPPPGMTPGAPSGGLSKKKAVPDAEALKTAQESIKTLFKDDFAAAKKPEQKIDLARRIKAKGDQMGDDSNAQYAAYEEALDLALAANESVLGWAIVESIGDSFDVPLPKLQFEVLQKASTQVKSPVQAKAWCELAEQTLLLATQQDDLDTGSKLGKMAVARAKMVDPGTHKRFVDLSADIEEMKKGFTTVGTALETLKTSPDDPAANAQVGRYRCFQKKDWDGGLPHLAKGDDGALKIAAAKELVRQTSPKELVALADLWYGAAQERTNPKEKQALMAHANGYYQLALPSLEGFERAAVSKKLEDYIAPLWNRIRLAMKGRKLTTTTLAGTNQFGAAQMDLPNDPRLLTGLRFTSYNFTGGINGRYSVITKITPTYYTPTGMVEGSDEGYTEFNVAAKPGYVVGSIAVNCSNEYVHGVQITFVALDGDKLNARDSYTSPFYGSRTGGTVTLGSNSQPIVSLGQFGSTSYLRGMQLLLSP